MHVTDLNSVTVFSRIFGHEHRPLHYLPSSRFGTSPDTRPHRKAVRAHALRSTFRMPPATHLHGFRADDFQGRTARHRYLPQRQVRHTLSSWFHRTGCQIDSRGCQRKQGLADLGGFGQKFDAQSQASLCGRGSRYRSGRYDLRAGFHDNRLVAYPVSVGGLPADESRYQDAHPDRPAWPDSDLHQHHRSETARRGMARQPLFRSWSFLSHGSRLHGLHASGADCPSRSFLCHSCKNQSPIHAASLEACGQVYRLAQRPCWKTGSLQIAEVVSRPPSESPILRCGNLQRADLPDQQLGNSGFDGCHALQAALGHRVVLSMDQRPPANQALLRHQPQRGEDPDLDCGLHLPDDRDPSQAAQAARNSPQNFADFEYSSFRESPSK